MSRMKRTIYEPVREFERQTSYCPLYLAWRIVDEARDYFRTEIPESYARKLARRAEAVFAHHPFWARKASPRAGSRKASNFAEASIDRSPHAGARQQFQCQRQYEFILMFMRHWLAGVLARERPALFRQLPESFKIGHPLPEKMEFPHNPHPAPPPSPAPAGEGHHLTPALSPERRGRNIRPRFVHGCELLTI